MIQYNNEFMIAPQNRYFGMGNHFACYIVEFVTNGLYGMFLPTFLHCLFEHKRL